MHVQGSTFLTLCAVPLAKADHTIRSRVSLREIGTGKCGKVRPLQQAVCRGHTLCVSSVLGLMLPCRCYQYLPVNLLPVGWMLCGNHEQTSLSSLDPFILLQFRVSFLSLY